MNRKIKKAGMWTAGIVFLGVSAYSIIIIAGESDDSPEYIDESFSMADVIEEASNERNNEPQVVELVYDVDYELGENIGRINSLEYNDEHNFGSVRWENHQGELGYVEFKITDEDEIIYLTLEATDESVLSEMDKMIFITLEASEEHYEYFENNPNSEV